MPDASLDERRDGRVVTFYSYKGGTGRTMALANVAWILASNGHRVLVADWDLESPGLHRFFSPFLDQAMRDAAGVIEMVRDYEWAAAEADDDEELRQAHIDEHARIQKYVIPLRHWAFPRGGSLEFLSPGRQDRAYMTTLSALDWDNFYERLNGGEFLDALRADMKRHYDYALIDSRTGLSDVADICTVQLPDVLVDCFTLSTQGVEGAVQVARRIEEIYGYRGIRVLPVPMRVDLSEQERVEASRAFARRRFENLPAEMTPDERRVYWSNVEIPYRPYYAYEEMLAVFGDPSGNPGSMLSAYERLTGYITGNAVTSLPVIDEGLRNSTRALFDRKPPLDSKHIVIEFLAEDQLWAEWIGAVLRSRGFIVQDRHLAGQDAAAEDDADGTRTLTVISAAYMAWRRSQGAGIVLSGHWSGEENDTARLRAHAKASFAVYVTAAPVLSDFSPARSVSLAGARGTAEAMDRVLRLLPVGPDVDEPPVPLPRYPGDDPLIIRGVGARNERFTGRKQGLEQLREQFRNPGMTEVMPVTLHGTAGVGKTAVALEYVHRFKNDYDLIWWVACGRFEDIDTKLAELTPMLEERFAVNVPAEATIADRARLALDVLSGDTVPRWLLVYDNAEKIDAIREFLPVGGGHVLITSQNQGWADEHTRMFSVSEFKREESVAYLLRLVPSLGLDEANAIAAALGDLPVAITAVAAYLRDTGYPVVDLLSGLERESAVALAVGPLADYPKGVAAAWDLPVALLRDRSPAAARLLELCSVMAPEVALDLVYSSAMVELLEPYDAALSEPLIMGRVVQEATRQNLLRLDSTTKQIQIHQVLQTVVRNRLMSPEQVAVARTDAQKVLLASRPAGDAGDPATWERFRMIWPHLGFAEVVSSTQDRARQLIIDRVQYLYEVRDLDRAAREAARAADRWDEMLAGKTIPDRPLRIQLLQLRRVLGNILRYQSKFQQALELDERVFAAQSELLGDDHPHTLMTAGGLAADLRALGRYGQALSRDKITYPRWVAQYGENNLRSLQAANNLAVSYRLTGDITSALQLDRDTRQRAASVAGTTHPFTLLAGRNLARDLLEAGQYAEAAAISAAVHHACADNFGADSSDALEAQVLRAIALRSAGQIEEAETYFDDALDQLAGRFGADSGATLACRLSKATNMVSLERFAEAADEIRLVLGEYEQTLGRDHPHSLVCQVNLATALRQLNVRDRAMNAINTARKGLHRSLGQEHPYTLAAAMVEGVLLADEGELGKAAELETLTATAMARSLGPGHPDTLRCQANLLLTRKDLGENTAQQRNGLIAQLELLLGAEHPTVETLRGDRRLMRALDPQPF
jgi:MinD-like ATPase involved in chromosome partitioning or flagellar assembly/tetratricopeptide (TPR) repeat protein